MNAIRRKTMVKFCLAMGLFILAGVFRQLDQDIPPLAAAVKPPPDAVQKSMLDDMNMTSLYDTRYERRLQEYIHFPTGL